MKKPYNGNDEFIFVSYAHKDMNKVLPIIEKLIDSGYRVWYDEGIDPGTEWDEFIASHVDGCAYFIAFISNAYIESGNCKDELNFARDLNKDRLLVYIEHCELPLGMKMRLGRLQSIFEYRYSDKDEFWKKLTSANNISNCFAGDGFSYDDEENDFEMEAPEEPEAPEDFGFFEDISSHSEESYEKKKTESNLSAKELYDLGEQYYNGDGVEEDIEKAVEYYKLAADRGYDEAQFCLGEYYTEEENEELGVKYYKLAASQGHALAYFRLGSYYEYEEDYESAFKYYKMAADHGEAAALIELGSFYDEGLYVEKNIGLAKKYYQSALDKGYSYVISRLAEIKDDNELTASEAFTKAENAYSGNEPCNGSIKIKTDPDYAKAAKYYRIAADLGHTMAQLYYARCCKLGEGVPKNYSEAAKYYRSVAEKTGDPVAQYNLGVFYENGQGVLKNYTEAVKYYKLAAEQGHSDAEKALKRLQEQPEEPEEPEDFGFEMEAPEEPEEPEDFGFFVDISSHSEDALAEEEPDKTEGSQGLFPPEVFDALGEQYYFGDGVEQNYGRAAEAFQIAADQGIPNAQYNLGVCYENGHGVSQSYTKAAKYYKLAADQGLAKAQCNLGICYEYGYGVPQDYIKAVNYYKLAAKQNYAPAQCNLGYCYKKGYGVPKDYFEAVKYYKLAAAQGDEIAQCNLGYCYEHGEGVPKDYDKAKKYYKLAADQGDEEAKEKLKQLKKKMRRF